MDPESTNAKVEFTLKELLDRQQEKLDRLESRIQELEKTSSSAKQALQDLRELRAEVSQLESFKSDLSGRITATTVGLGVVFTLIQIGLHFWKN
jgi:Tfp pilus assembly protein PilN